MARGELNNSLIAFTQFESSNTEASCNSVAPGEGTVGAELAAFQSAFNRVGGQSSLGCPTAVVRTDGFTSFAGTIGHFQTFDRGGLQYHANNARAGQAYAVVVPVWTKWTAFAFNASHPLGYPIADLSGTLTSSTNRTWRHQRFEGGIIATNLGTGASFEVHGGIWQKYEALGMAAWWGGLPTSDEHDAPASPQGHTGRVSDFERGHIWWRSAGTAAFQTQGDIDAVYMTQNGPASCLGYPITDEFRNSSNRAQSNFVGGHITTLDGVTYQPFCGGTSQHTLTTTISGSGTVTSAPAGITCSSGTCSANFAANSSVQLTATPAGGWRFGGWTGALSGTASPQTVTMSVSRSVGATFLQTAPAQMTSPAPGSTLTASTVTFQWSGGTGASQYWLYIGNTAGANDLYGQNQGTSLSATVAGLPSDGRRVFVRLWSSMGGLWQFIDYTYTATTPTAAPAQMTSPAPGSTLTASTVTFQWTGGTGVSQYWLYVGNAAGASDLYGQNQGTGLTATVAGLPSDGRTLHVRLWSLIGSAWQLNDYTYTAAAAVPARAQMISPAPGSTLTASTITFQWSGGTGVAQYWLYVGNSAGASDVYGQNRLTSLTATVAGLPSDGRRLHVRLWSLIGGVWESNDYTYTAVATTARAQMTSPAPGSTLSSSTVTYQWSGGTGVSQYWLSVGSAQGGSDLYGQNQGTGLTATVAGLPSDGRTLHVRLWSSIGAAWQFNDYTYVAATSAPARAQMTSPAPGSALTASTVTFQWTGGTGVSQYWLSVGNAAAGTDLYSQNRGTSLTATVPGLPADGRTLYVRLWSLIGTAWLFNDYTYTAPASAAARAQMTSPAPGSTLTASTVTFQWTGGTGVSQYWLNVGSTAGGTDLFGQNRGTSLTATVAGLPADGRTLHVRLWSLIAGAWQFNDYTYTAASVELAVQSCALEGTFRSIEGVELVPILFVNASGQERRIFWLDYAGARVQYHTLQPDESYVQNAYLTHPWLVSNAADACQGIYLPVSGGARATLR